MAFDDQPTQVKQVSKAESFSGKLDSQFEEDKLMKSVLQNDKSTIDEGKLLNEAINQGIVAFTPDLMFSQIVKNYRMAENVYGEKLIKLLTGYNPDYLRKNIAIPEFNRELRVQLGQKLEKLKDDDVISKEGHITSLGLSLASVVLYMEELDHLLPKGWRGDKTHNAVSPYGNPEGLRAFSRTDRYRDVAVRQSIRMAVRRKHAKLKREDLQSQTRKAKGHVYVMYGLDASGSMKGPKIEMAKKAGIALCHAAISRKDKAGLIVFGSTIKESVAPTDDLRHLVEQIVSVRPSRQTDFTGIIARAVELFPAEKVTKHLILLTDALPTVGAMPEEETLQAISKARAAGISISLVGIQLDKAGHALAEKIVRLGEGRLYVVRNLSSMDRIVIEDYYQICA